MSAPNLVNHGSRILLRDEIYLQSSADVQNLTSTRYLVFVISGNPGLIEYYRSFITSLNGQLSKSCETHAGRQDVFLEFYGRSMAGFELTNPDKQNDSIERQKKCCDLKEQIQFMETQLIECANRLTNESNGTRPKIILIGHSVGSYILLELIQRHRRRLGTLNRSTTIISKEKETNTSGLRQRKSMHEKSSHSEPDIIAGICLFPTIVDIGQSKQGRILTTLSRIPYFPSIISLFAALLTFILSVSTMQSIVSLITGMPNHPASVTTAFIRSPTGVKQALFMGADEMHSITTDKWDEEVWGAGHVSPSSASRPQLYFYFGRNDHWVADRTRDELMALRGRGEGGEEWRPWMEIDAMGVPHGFCINHSTEIAGKCAEYIEKIIVADRRERSDSSKSDI